MTETLLGDYELETKLRLVTDTARKTVVACDGASITLREDEGLTTRAPSDDLARDLDHEQYRMGEGPCLQALFDRRPYAVASTAADVRWPRFARAAMDRGVKSVESIPILVDGDLVGALNLYSNTDSAFDDTDHEIGLLLGAQASIALRHAKLLEVSQAANRALRETGEDVTPDTA